MHEKPRKSQGASEQREVFVDKPLLERIYECERIIAAQVASFLKIELGLNEDEDLASGFGMSVFSQVLKGLVHSQTPEALHALELAYTGLEYPRYPHHYASLEECLATIKTVPENSVLPQAVAKSMLDYMPPEDSLDQDPLGEALRFFSRCSSAQIRTHLQPLVSSHPVPSMRGHIERFIWYHCPETIPASEIAPKLRELLTHIPLKNEDTNQAKEWVSLLGNSSMARSELLSLFGELLPGLVKSQDTGDLWVAEAIIEVVTQGEDTTEEISACVWELLRSACQNPTRSLTLEMIFNYVRTFHPLDLEGAVFEYLSAFDTAMPPQGGRFYAEKAINTIDELRTPQSLTILANGITSGALFARSKKFNLDQLLSNTSLPEKKGELALHFFEDVEDMLRAAMPSNSSAEDEKVRQRALRPAHDSNTTLVAQHIAAGGFTGERALATLRYFLEDPIQEAASVKQIFAARLIAGHDSPEVEDILYSAFRSTTDPDFKRVLAESLAKRRGKHTSELLIETWSASPENIPTMLLCFNKTKDPSELRAILQLCRGYLNGLTYEPKDVEQILITAMDIVVDSPGDDVDTLFFEAITSPFEKISRHAAHLCFSSKNQRKWYVTYRPEEYLVNLAIRLYTVARLPERGKLALAALLGRHATQEAVTSFLKEQLEKEQVSDALSAALFSALASSSEPQHVQNFFDFLRRRRVDPSNSPSIGLEVGLTPEEPGLFHITHFTRGDSDYLGNAMDNVVKLKRLATEIE
jgi:hypothetical protein